jgi:uncharacterized pyridoxal phosphate-dependent enzyme
MTGSIILKQGPHLKLPDYESLGVDSFINCTGTYTTLSGSLMPRQVLEAIFESHSGYVEMDDLMEKAGAWIARKTGAEWGLVTCGAAAALAMVTAACVAGADPEKIVRLPVCAGMKNEVIIQKAHRFVFDHAVRMVGVEMIEVSTEKELEARICDRTAMIVFLGEKASNAGIPLSRMTSIGHRRRLPVVVDAAAERPDVPNRYLQEGADVVIYSGGKCLRGPQSSGLVIGKKELLKTAYLHEAPHHGLGRPMKVSKETVMGLLAAVELWLNRDHDAEWKMWEAMIHKISGQIASIPSIRTTITQPGRSNVAPTLTIEWDRNAVPITSSQAQVMLKNGRPGIRMPLAGEGLSIMPYMMEPGDETVVARRLTEIFESANRNDERVERAAPPVEIAGVWGITIDFRVGQASHSAELIQNDSSITGLYYGSFRRSELTGTVHSNRIELNTRIEHEASSVAYRFTGTVKDNLMSGEVDLGQYGSAKWTAALERRAG